MTGIKTVEESEVEGDLTGLYEGMLTKLGWVPNIVKNTSIRPERPPMAAERKLPWPASKPYPRTRLKGSSAS